MQRDPHGEPVTLNYACVLPKAQPSSIPTILGTLAGLTVLSWLVVPLLTSTSCQNYCVDATRANMGTLRTVFELYRLHVGSYPGSLDDLMAPPAGEAGASGEGPIWIAPTNSWTPGDRGSFTGSRA